MQILCPSALNIILEVPHLICQATGSDTSVFMNRFLLLKLLKESCYYVQYVHILNLADMSCIVSTFRLSNVLVLDLDSKPHPLVKI